MEISENIKEAGYGKHILSYLIDAAIVIVTGGIVFGTLTSTYMLKAIGGNQAAADCLKIQADSGLYKMTVDSGGNYTAATSYDFTSAVPSSSSSSASGLLAQSPLMEAFPDQGAVYDEDSIIQTRPAYAEYMDMLWFYYTDFLPRGLTSSAKYDSRIKVLKDSKGNAFASLQDYYAHFEMDILGLPKTSLYDETPSMDESASTLYNDSPFYRYSLSDDKKSIDIAKEPVLQEKYQAKVDAADTTTLGDLKNYFHTSASDYVSASGLYVTAMADFEGGSSSSSQSYFSSREANWSLLIYACIWTAFLPFQLVFFFLIPLLMPNGETLGKKICGLGVIGINDVKMRPWQKIIRPLLASLLGLLVIVPFLGILAPMAFVIIALVDYMMVMLSKKHQSLHDKFTKTIVVNVKNSTWFASEKEKADHEASNSASPLDGGADSDEVVLDLSTINKNREEAKNMTSFDDYEKSKEAEAQAKEVTAQPMVNLTKEEEPLAGTKAPEAPAAKEAEKSELPPDESGFTDGTKTGGK